MNAERVEDLGEKFDFVICRFLLMHQPNPKLLLTKFKNVLKPGGKIVFIETLGDYTITAYPMNPAFHDFIEMGVKQFELQGSNSSVGYTLPLSSARTRF